METKDILKSLRKSNGYNTLQEFCAAVDINFSTYQNYEAGKRIPTAEILIKLADFYGVTVDYLLGRPTSMGLKSPLDEFAQREHLKMLEKLFMKKYLSLTSEQRDKVLDFLREIVADEAAAAAAAEEARSQMEAVRVAAYQNPAGSVPREAEYPQEMLDDMDKNAPLTDPVL